MRMLAQRALLACLSVVGGVCPCSAENAAARTSRTLKAHFYPRSERLSREDRLAVIGDVQRTSFWGRLVLAESNSAEQKWLVDDLAKQQFRGLVLLGDMVFSPGDDNWNYFDRLFAPLRQGPTGGAGDPPVSERETRYFFPVMGNHEYMGDREQAALQLSRRFDGLLEHTHYAFDWHHVRMIVLDGNRGRLCTSAASSSHDCESDWQAQLSWLRSELRRVDQAPAEEQRAALLFVHQSPYTQSPWVAGDQANAREFANVLFESPRALGLISAHAHGFERYTLPGEARAQPPKVFIVSAGGGGPRPHFRRPWAAPDSSKLPWPRPFNYLLLRQDLDGIQIEVRGLEKGKQVVTTLAEESVTLPFH
ncbi:MAG TPA: metallophosphoesterase [Polyangiaceae bacterium]|nr:metallophosphoesterase [Polyangiaceae bacterium]